MRKKKPLLVCIALLCITAQPPELKGQEEPRASAAPETQTPAPKDKKDPAGWRLSAGIGASVNPLGLTQDTRIYYSQPLFPNLQGLLWDSSRIEAGLHNALTPAFDTLSAYVRIVPVAILDICASAGLSTYYNTFGYGYSPLSGYSAEWDSRALDKEERTSAEAFQYNLTAVLQGKAGPLSFLCATGITLYDLFRPRTGPGYYYDPSSDTALKRRDSFLTNDTLVLYSLSPRLTAGLMHSLLWVPASGYSSRRISLLCRAESPLGPRLTAAAALVTGLFLKDKYNSYKEGKIYAALQAGITLKL
ncbi:MAG: hypothetical protein LBC67_06730 [Spirochaetales bacterium]|jgi:hypothetical protein|nr:hypothetical protein [Spirochaetales bacterium]